MLFHEPVIFWRTENEARPPSIPNIPSVPAPPSGSIGSRATTVHSQLPAVLVVDADPALLEQCRAAALEMGFRLKLADVASMASVAVGRMPFAIVTTTETYAKSALEFHMVAERTDARLVCVSSRAKCELLKLMLRSARQASAGRTEPG